MQLARVIGTVVATVKSPGLEGVKFLIIQPLDREKQPSGAPLVAADAVYMAGPGELVYFVAAREASQALRETFVPIDHAIVGIVDGVEAIGLGGGRRRAGDGSAGGSDRSPGAGRGSAATGRRSARSRGGGG